MSPSSQVATWFSRPVQGVLMIGVLVVLLQLPIALIREVIGERLVARDAALAEVTSTWGSAQSIIGPRLVVPYRRGPDDDGRPRPPGLVSILPAALDIEGSVTGQALHRGLFAVPVYDASITLSGGFETVDALPEGVETGDVLWAQAELVVEVSEPKSLGPGSGVTWNGERLELLPGAGTDRLGVHSPVELRDGGEASFTVALELKGSDALWLAPFARSTRVSLTSNWPHPSFSGAWLPEARSVDGSGFAADWEVPFLGRNYPQSWTQEGEPQADILDSRFGLQLLSPVDHYRMSERSTKYAALFLALTFGLFWLFDTVVGVRIHPIQYLLVGAAMCTFYLLELSLSEHVGFVAAYGIAAGGVVALIASYTKAVLGSLTRGVLMAGATGLLYGYLFALLTLERYALLVGSLGLFSALATVMHLTRGIDWHRAGATRDTAAS
jgi:inner membrane protein